MSGWATSSSPPRSRTSGTSRACPSRLGYLLDLAPKDLEKVIYFAAYMITSVDEEGRHRDLPSPGGADRRREEGAREPRDADVDARAKKLEADLAELEAEGAKGDARRKVREGAEREMNNIRKRADAADRAPRAGLGPVQEPQGPGPRGRRDALPRDARPLRPVLRGRHGRRGDPEAPGDLRPGRRGGDRCARSSPPARARARPAPSSASRSSPRSRRPRNTRWAWCSTASR